MTWEKKFLLIFKSSNVTACDPSHPSSDKVDDIIIKFLESTHRKKLSWEATILVIAYLAFFLYLL